MTQRQVQEASSINGAQTMIAEAVQALRAIDKRDVKWSATMIQAANATVNAIRVDQRGVPSRRARK
jgi:hypothetical protein